MNRTFGDRYDSKYSPTGFITSTDSKKYKVKQPKVYAKKMSCSRLSRAGLPRRLSDSQFQYDYERSLGSIRGYEIPHPDQGTRSEDVGPDHALNRISRSSAGDPVVVVSN